MTSPPPEPPAQASGPPAEGIIQFAYELREQEARLAEDTFDRLRGWRSVLVRLGLLGRDPERYGGHAFGNLSARDSDTFVITASQSSQVAELTSEHLCRIRGTSVARNWVEAEGLRPPSSEALTHAMVYAADPGTQWVFHVHAPDIWHGHEALALPAIGSDVSYGSQAMATSVAALLEREPTRPLAFATLGHEDGVFVCAADADEAGALLARLLARCL